MPTDALPSDDAEQLLPLWADNAAAVGLFGRCCTQWNYAGITGVATGLRYEALPFLIQLQATPAEDLAELVDCLQVMEAHALEVMGRNRRGGWSDG